MPLIKVHGSWAPEQRACLTTWLVLQTLSICIYSVRAFPKRRCPNSLAIYLVLCPSGESCRPHCPPADRGWVLVPGLPCISWAASGA